MKRVGLIFAALAVLAGSLIQCGGEPAVDYETLIQDIEKIGELAADIDRAINDVQDQQKQVYEQQTQLKEKQESLQESFRRLREDTGELSSILDSLDSAIAGTTKASNTLDMELADLTAMVNRALAWEPPEPAADEAEEGISGLMRIVHFLLGAIVALGVVFLLRKRNKADDPEPPSAPIEAKVASEDEPEAEDAPTSEEQSEFGAIRFYGAKEPEATVDEPDTEKKSGDPDAESPKAAEDSDDEK